jgi:hypothetical protein
MRSIKEALRDLQQRRGARQAERATTRGERAQRDAEAKARFASTSAHREATETAETPAAPDSEASVAVQAEP